MIDPGVILIMRKFLGIVLLSLVASVPLVAAAVPRADAALAVRRFVLSTSCERQGGSANAWFLIPQREEAAQRVAEHGGPGTVPDQVWIDISLVDNGFAEGTYLGAGPFLPPVAGTASFVWSGLVPGRLHVYRLNARVGDRWFELGSATFETPDCKVVRALSCNSGPPSSSVSFVVSPAARSEQGGVPIQQWLDLSLFDGRFAPGLFLGIGPLPVSGTSLLLPGIQPASRHYFRVNADYGPEGWRVLAEGTFLSMNCFGLPENISLPM